MELGMKSSEMKPSWKYAFIIMPQNTEKKSVYFVLFIFNSNFFAPVIAFRFFFGRLFVTHLLGINSNFLLRT